MKLAKKKTNRLEIVLYIVLLALSGCLYILPTTVYINNKIVAIVSIIAFFIIKGNKIRAIKSKSRSFETIIIWFLIIVIFESIYSMIYHYQNPANVLNICGGYFSLFIYFIFYGSKISKKKIQEIFVTFTKIILIIFFAQFLIFQFSGKILFIDFNHRRMRAGFLRVGVGSTFVAISLTLLFAEVLNEYRKTKKLNYKNIIWIGILLVYLVMYICTRALILSVFISFVILSIWGTKNKKIKAIICLIGLVGTYYLLNSEVFSKYMMIDILEGGGSVNGRLQMYSYYLDYFIKNPLFGEGFIYPSNSELTTLLYGYGGYYHLDDVGIVGYIFTFGIPGIVLMGLIISKAAKNIYYAHKDKSLYDNSEMLGIFVLFITTFPTLFFADYGRNGYLGFVLLFLTPEWLITTSKQFQKTKKSIKM